ncbi:alpha/beta hydrolase [Phenylobacterium sp.]|uniref:alpha/beta fold hydrolase n=1 Tax=Phenylobacterium sp. TaxID=1871053 RepID=UPI0025DBC3E7|nr:alpha/beta hydrolase [Phenylobacterium sp.]
MIRPRMIHRCLVAVAVAFLGPVWSAEAAETAPSADFARASAQPHEPVDVGGRRLNLFCMGDGPRTVLFEAGGSDWSDVWALVQPVVAQQARACAYDRAGLGYSDPAPLPRTPLAIVQDLHALIAAAKLKTPLVLVGHSLGGFDAKLYAALYPEDVAGLVLIDPAEDRTAQRVRMLLRGRFGPSLAARSELLDLTMFAWLTDRYDRCAEAARDKPLDPGSPTYRRCTDPVRPQLGPDVAAARARIQATAAYQAAQASEISNSVYADERADPVYEGLFRRGAFGRKPLVVLTHGDFDRQDQLDVASQAAGIALHQETARLSRTGRHRVVPGTGHYIQLDAPESVTAAISEVLAALPRS